MYRVIIENHLYNIKCTSHKSIDIRVCFENHRSLINISYSVYNCPVSMKEQHVIFFKCNNLHKELYKFYTPFEKQRYIKVGWQEGLVYAN